MPIATLRPDSDVTIALITFGAGVGNYGRVNETTADDTNGVFRSDSASTFSDIYGLPDPSLSGTISSVTVFARAWRTTHSYESVQGTAQLGVSIGGTSYLSLSKALGYAAGSISQAWATNPNTSAAWTWANINDLRVVVSLSSGLWNDGKNSGTLTTYASQVWVEVNYTTVAAPTVTTQAATSVTSTTCTGNGNITATGGATVTRRGFCYFAGSSGDPTVSNSMAYDDGSFGTGAYTKSITGLSPGTAYRVRAYAVNSAGTSYGTTVDVTTSAVAPTVTTQAATSVTSTTCTGNGNITATGGATVTRRGFCYLAGSSGEPTTADSVAYDDGSFGTGTYTKSITGLSPGTAYRVRAYAVNSAGTSYGTTVDVTTSAVAPTVTTQAATSVTSTTCTGNGNITATGGATVTRRGFCYLAGSSGEPTTADSVAYDDGSFGTGTYTKSITGLSPGTAYRVRAYAVNSAGTSYGTTVDVTTSAVAPTVTTQAATSILDSSCTGNGNITATGGANATRRGFCYLAGSSGDPTVSNSVAYDDGSFGTGAYTKSITGLSPGTAYRVRAYAINSAGTAYGTTVDVTTSEVAPTVTTQAATDVAGTSCTGNGNITSIGGSNCTRRGFCFMVGTSGDPTTANNTAYDDGSFGTGAYTKSITGLFANTTYRVRAYAVNSGGTSYGTTVQITTLSVAPTVTTQDASDVSAATCTGNGNITATGGATVGRRGFCYMVGVSGDPTVSDSVAYDDGSFGTGAYTKLITGLTANTTYRVRAYAVNSEGTSYGTTVQITTLYVAPTVTTQAATDIASTSCTGNGNITSIGGTTATRRGFCYFAGSSGDPTVSDSVAYDDGSFGTGAFTKSITGLLAGTSYRVRAYAINAGGTSYGTTVDVTTSEVAPTVTTQAATDVAGTSCTGNGNITATGGATVTRRGFCYLAGSTGDPTVSDSVAYDDGSFGTGAYTKSITGLFANTTYRVRAYAVNSEGTSYGTTVQITTLTVAPTVTTQAATSVTSTSCTGNGNITATGGAAVTRRGFCYLAGSSGEPTVSNSVAYDDGSFGTGTYTKSITGLSPGTAYRVRAYAVNSAGTSYGTTVDVTTSAVSPTVTTQAATSVTPTGFTGNGNITATGGANATRRGFCYLEGAEGDPTIDDDAVYEDGDYAAAAYALAISGLRAGTSYQVRAYAINPVGTSYGTTVQITTLYVAPTVTTQAPTGLTDTTCTGNGTITDTGGNTVTKRGFCYISGTSGTPTIANEVVAEEGSYDAGAFALFIAGLSASTSYRIRAYAINSVGIAYGETLTMTTTAVPVKRLFNASFVTEKNKRADGPKPINLVTFGFSTAVNVSDREVTPAGGPAHAGIVKRWGYIDTSISQQPGSGVLGSIEVPDVEITLINTTAPRFTDNFLPDDPPENVAVFIYQWFGGTVYAEREIIFKGYVSGAIRYDEYTCTLTVRGVFDRYNKKIGEDNLVTAALYPQADPDDIGKMRNIGYGALRDVPCRAVKAGVIDTLRDDLTAVATSFYVSGDVVVDYPSGTVTVQIDAEQIRGTYSPTTHRFTSVTRGYNATVTTSHDKGASVAQVLTEYIYEAFGHPAHAIGDVRVDGVAQTSGYAVYTGQTGNVLAGYENRSVIRFTALPVVKKQVNLSVSQGSHEHLSSTAIIISWKFDTASPSGSVSFASSVVDGNMSTQASMSAGSSISVWKNLRENIIGQPVRFRPCLHIGGPNDASITFGFAGGMTGGSESSTTYRGSWVTCTGDLLSFDGFLARQGGISRGTSGLNGYPAEVWLEIEYRPTTATSPASGVELSGNSSADTVIGSRVTCDASGYRDDASGTYTGIANTLIERPDHVLRHIWAVVMGAPAEDINIAAFSAAGTLYAANNYRFAFAISEPIEAEDLLMSLAHQCRSRLVVTAYGRALLYARQLGQTSAHAITKNEIKRDSMAVDRTTTDEIFNVFNVSYDLDLNKGYSGNPESYNSVIKLSDATSISRYGQREWKGSASVFCFNAIRQAAMAQHVGQFYLDYHKRARKLPAFSVFLDNIEIEPGDIIDLTHPLDNMAGFVVEVRKVIHHIGSRNQIDYIDVITAENGT